MTRARSRRTARRKIKRLIRKTLKIVCAVWDFIARHPAMQELFHEYGITERPAVVCEKENAHITVHKVTVAELVQGQILGQTDTQMQEKFLKE